MSQPNSAAAPPRNEGAINLFRATVPICAVVAVVGILFAETMADGATARAAFNGRWAGPVATGADLVAVVFLAWLGFAVFRKPRRKRAGATAK